MSDRDDLLGEDFEWMDESRSRTGLGSREPGPTAPPRSLTSDLDRLRNRARGSPRLLALLALAILVAVAIVVAIVLSTGGNEQTGGTAQTTSSGAPSQTEPQSTTPAPTARPAITVSPSSVLRPGDNGPGVRTLQRALRRLGFAVGVDGVFGPKTEAAVISFQRGHGLSGDGVVGGKTARALNTALAQAG